MENQAKQIKAFFIGGAIVIFAIITLLSCVSIVPAGKTGVLVTMGKVDTVAKPEGVHFKVPFVSQIIKFDTRVLKSEVTAASASKDMQAITSTIAINYRVSSESAPSLYKSVGLDYNNVVIAPAIQEAVKAVTAKYTAEQLITERQTVSTQMLDALNSKMNKFGIYIEIFNITDFQFSTEFNAAIEAKQTAQQNALKAEQDLQRIKIEAQQQIEQAKAEAESYKLKNLEITDETIIMEYLSKWDGKLPVVSSDGNQILDISSIIKTANSNKVSDPNPEPVK